jgi:serine-type D-Ala-D-Ala carboxypeptidase/endopeptidase (penicillin-binding protein 4)
MRRNLLPAALAVVAIAAGAFALRPTTGAAEGEALAVASTPVLSPRRVPSLVRDLAAEVALSDAVDEVLADQALASARDDMCLVVSSRGDVVLAREPDRALIPASNMKLLVALGALERLGADTTLRTAVRARVAGGIVGGDLWLVGGGDPLLATKAYADSLPRQPQPHTSIEELAQRVRAAGVTEVRGRVLGDESRYDTERYAPEWKPQYRRDNEVGPQSALTVNDGFAVLRPRRQAAEAPAVAAAATFTAALQAAGVVVAGAPGSGRAPDGTPEIAAIESLPVRSLVAQMLVESDNLTAELLVKELAAHPGEVGTTDGGLAVVRSVLAALGLPLEGFEARDGSGLAREDRVTCRMLHAALADPAREETFEDALAVANRTGTLAPPRFAGNPAAGRLRAKTGSLDGVSALSGYVDARDGTLAFSFILNDLPARDLRTGPRAWERLGAALAAWPATPDLDELGPTS